MLSPKEEQELRAWAIEMVLGQYRDRYAEHLVKQLIEHHGSATAAYQNMNSDTSFVLGHYGYCGNDHRLDAMGGAKTGKIQAWLGPHHWSREPDVTLSWLDVFKHVAGEDEQMALF